jgi:glycosyltransferase involved in cell wall biosynthesis
VIVVDGSSKDRTVMKAREYLKKLPYMRIITSSASLPLQRNIGSKYARGDYLAFIDADSVLMPYFFERLSVYIRKNDAKLITSWCQPDTDKPTDAVYALFGNLVIEGLLIFKRPLTPGPLTIINRRVFVDIGGYDESHHYNEDIDLGLRLHQRGIHLTIIREALYIWSLRRIRNENKFKVIQQYLISAIPVLFLKKSMKNMPGYVMGGQLYDNKQKPITPSVLKEYETKVKRLISELFD